jgi:hypothetical protein
MIERESFFLLHQTLYFLVAFGAILLSIKMLVKKRILSEFSNSKFSSKFFLLCFTIIVGLRAYNVGTDTGNYYNAWNVYSLSDVKGDMLYYLIMYGVKIIGLNYQFFLFVDASIFSILLYFSLKNLSKFFKVHQFLLLFAFLSFFFSLSLSINVVRQGNALMLLLLAYSFFILGKPKKYLLLCLTGALFFHLTAIIPIMAFLIVYFFKKLSVYFWLGLYFIALVLSYLDYGILNISPLLVDLLEGDKRLTYIEFDDTKYVIGFKPQFAIFNTVFLFLGLYLLKNLKVKEKFRILLKYFMLSSILFFMAFQIPFSDRWGLFSWIVIPIIMGQFFSLYNPKRFAYLFQTVFLISIFIYFNIYAKS